MEVNGSGAVGLKRPDRNGALKEPLLNNGPFSDKTRACLTFIIDVFLKIEFFIK